MTPELRSILRDAVGPRLAERIARASDISAPRCYRHPESPTGYVGAGRWCEHKRAQLAEVTVR